MGPALQWRQWDDRNDEFWGHQFWVGENPPTQAVIQMYFKKSLSDAKLQITDATGKRCAICRFRGTVCSPAFRPCAGTCAWMRSRWAALAQRRLAAAARARRWWRGGSGSACWSRLAVVRAPVADAVVAVATTCRSLKPATCP